MTSSGMKRGLAVTAVSALAVTGLPFLTAPANADTINTQVGTGNVVLYSLYNTMAPAGDASLKNDGQNTTVHLLAGGGSDVTSVKFQYKIEPAGAFQDITTVNTRNNDGAFSYEWDATGIAGATVTVRVIGTTETGDLTPVDKAGVILQPSGAAAESVNLTNGSALGVFQQPYAGPDNKQWVSVAGTTSATAGDVVLSTRSGGAAATTTTPVTTATPTSTTGMFRGALDITGYVYDLTAGPVDEIVIGAERDTDDVEAYTLYKQAITTITAVATDGTAIGNPPGGTKPVLITVTDASGNPIAGAQVYDDLDDTPVGYTDANGQVSDAAGAGTHEYYANATGTTPYEPELGDKKAGSVTITQYTPAPSSLAADSADGSAFDDDEYALGDITVQVQDQSSEDFGGAGQVIEYHWVLTPFDGDPATVRVPTTSESLASTDADGEASIVFPTAEESGTYELFAGRRANVGTGTGAIAMSKVLTVQAGEADIKFDESSPEQAAAGTDETVTGTLELENGTTLPGRLVDLTFQRGAESGTGADAADAQFAAVGTTPAGLTRQVTTSAAGAFSVVVDDAAQTPQPKETGGNIDAVTANTPDIGDAADSTMDHGVDFLTSLTPASIELDTDNLFTFQTPGRPVAVEATVENAEGDRLNNVPVEVSVDRGFLTPAADAQSELVPDPAAAEGEMYGEWASLGDSETVSTDGSGVALSTVAIERDSGFDDDGEVTMTVTVTAGGVSETVDVDFSSHDPLNAGEARIELDDNQSVTVLPDAPTTENVRYNVFLEDQFGNLTQDHVDVSDNSIPAGFYTNWSGSDALSQFVFDSPAITAFSDAATSQAISIDWDHHDNVWEDDDDNDATPLTHGSNNLTLSDTAAAINWYVVDFAQSMFTINNTPGNRVDVGTAVTTTVKAVDQKGEPIQGLDVEFIRSGPGNLQDGDVNDDEDTNQNGETFYNFTGTQTGTALVSAVVSDGLQNKRLETRVRFVPARTNINAGLSLSNNRKGNDVAFVNAPRKAAGTMVKLYKVRKDGSKALVARKRANAAGNARFVAMDRAKNRFTTYQALVVRSADTFRDWTPKRRVR